MKQILLLDNYDSFTFNLKHYLVGLGVHVDVIRNDKSIADVEKYNGIILSPGPGLPVDAGQMIGLIDDIAGKIPLLGVCLGMQAIAIHLGGKLFNQNKVKHGVQEKINISGGALFKQIDSTIDVGLYHSWAVQPLGDFDVVANSKEGIVMAIENDSMKMYGVQFHPESVMTLDGMKIVKNFINLL
ncbi:MAG: aminodeoxychorismate/anthranilate synthase component II [Crocinitomicaceae bacterium]|nr:aminodeoxychorismate/anthranilate synthase component II [Crocinitomicaceae bacterium]